MQRFAVALAIASLVVAMDAEGEELELITAPEPEVVDENAEDEAPVEDEEEYLFD